MTIFLPLCVPSLLLVLLLAVVAMHAKDAKIITGLNSLDLFILVCQKGGNTIVPSWL